ncbi:MAG: phosphate acetyltransferase, partial [Spirochaetes bacterium]
MGFYENVWEKAKKSGARIVLPEATDNRVLRAAESAVSKGLVKEIILLGNPDEVQKSARELGLNLSGVNIFSYLNSDEFDSYVEEYYQLRKHKGISRDDAR